MKKKAVLALTLAGLVALQVPMVALAEDRTTKIEHTDGTYTYTYDNINVSGTNAVNAINSGTKINVTAGNITTTTLNIIQAKDGGQITVTADNISANSDSFSAAICLDGNGSSVTVTGARTSGTTATVAGGNNSGEGVLTRSSSQNGTATVNANVSGDNAVNIKGSNSNITVTGNVTGVTTGINAVGAGSVVSVTGDVVSAKKAINATNGTTVTSGSVVSEGDGVYAEGAGTTVTVNGNITSVENGISVCDGAAVTAGNVTVNVDNDCTSGVQVTSEGGQTGGDVKVGNITVNSSNELNDGVQVSLGKDNAKAEVTTGNIAVSGTYGTTGVQIDVSGVGAEAVVYVDGDIKTSDRGAYIEQNDGKTVLVTTGTIEGENYGLVIHKDSNQENIEIIAYELKTSESGTLIGKDTGVEIPGEDAHYVIEATNEYDSLVNYIIRKADGSESKLTTLDTTEKKVTVDGTEKTFDTATAGTKITIKAASGYEVKAGTLTVTREADGSYSVIVPAGGGVTLEAVMAAVQQAAEAEEKKATVTGSEGNAVAGGSWNCGPGETWTYRNNGIFKDTWGYITLSDGRTGWFWFDKSGVMAAGWKEINGKWYYFNEAHDGTYGMMLANTTTPDGKKVGADGAMIQ